MPGEDAKAYRGRLDAWKGAFSPRNDVETYLVERAVTLSWQLDRADRVQLAHLTALAERNASESGTVGGVDGPGGLPFDTSDPGRWMREYQLACGQAFFRALDALSGLRQMADLAACGAVTEAPAAAPVLVPIAADATLLTVVEPTAPASDDVSPLVAILQTTDPEGAPTITAGPAAPAVPTPARPVDRTPDCTQTDTTPGARRRLRRPRVGQPSWPGSGGSGAGATGVASMGMKSRPTRRPSDSSEPLPNAPESRCRMNGYSRASEPLPNAPDNRRRVGGYAVPIDQPITVTCADRIPVRLRREAAASRQGRAAAFPST